MKCWWSSEGYLFKSLGCIGKPLRSDFYDEVLLAPWSVGNWKH